jgi:hypothetical protein
MELGQKVTFQKCLRRSIKFEANESGWNERKNVWIEKDHTHSTGLIVGKRVLQNGISQWENEEGWVFIPVERVVAYLVAFNLHKKPVFVLPEHLTIHQP